MDNFLIEKMDLAIDRFKHERDSLFICDGSEGDGKTTLSISLGYYLAWKLGKPFSVDNVFFDVEKMMKFASENEAQIIIYDEACLMAMATSWQNKIQQKLIKVLMMARKKKHFFFFNIPKFRKLNEYIVDRAIGLVHVYSPDMIKQGHFVYFKKDQKDWLYENQKERGKKTYKMGWSFRGSFSNPKNLIDNVEYEKRKDEAIRSIFKDDVKKIDSTLEENKWLKERIASLPIKRDIKAAHFDRTPRTISKWAHNGGMLPSEGDLGTT